jgi:hypothetical protein
MSSNEELERNEAFLEIDKVSQLNEVQVLTRRVKTLEWDCAELLQSNSALQERVKKLASRQPVWPKGYRPQRRHNSTQSR